jgi:hypothetical protein
VLRIQNVYPEIPDRDFYPSRIPEPKTAIKERGEKKFVVTPFCSHKIHKTENYFILEMLKKKFGPVLEELWNFLPKQFVT